MAMRDVLSMTYVTDFVDAVKVIRGSPPPSAAVNLCRLGRVVFVDIKGRELGRYGSTQLITVVGATQKGLEPSTSERFSQLRMPPLRLDNAAFPSDRSVVGQCHRCCEATPLTAARS